MNSKYSPKTVKKIHALLSNGKEWTEVMQYSHENSIQSTVVQFSCHYHNCFSPAHALVRANFYGRLSVFCITGFWTLGVYSMMNNSYFSNQMTGI
jgi:hypothetical protein